HGKLDESEPHIRSDCLFTVLEFEHCKLLLGSGRRVSWRAPHFVVGKRPAFGLGQRRYGGRRYRLLGGEISLRFLAACDRDSIGRNRCKPRDDSRSGVNAAADYTEFP